MGETWTTYRALTAHDAALLAALRAGEPTVVAEVTRLLRLTPLKTLARHTDALVEVLAALPQLHAALRWRWSSQDPALTARLLALAAYPRHAAQPYAHHAAA